MVNSKWDEEREEKTEEFKKFLLRYTNDLKKLINDSKRLNDFSNDFVIDDNEMEKWGLNELIEKLTEELESLLRILEVKKILSNTG